MTETERMNAWLEWWYATKEGFMYQLERAYWEAMRETLRTLGVASDLDEHFALKLSDLDERLACSLNYHYNEWAVDGL